MSDRPIAHIIEDNEGLALECARLDKEIADLRQQLEQAEARADACQQEAQIWKQEARTQAATVAEIYQELTGKTGEPGDWHGARPVKAAVLRKQAEAVKALNLPMGIRCGDDPHDVIDDEAQRLRQQADESQKGEN